MYTPVTGKEEVGGTGATTWSGRWQTVRDDKGVFLEGPTVCQRSCGRRPQVPVQKMPLPPKGQASIRHCLLCVFVSLWFSRAGGWICVHLRYLRFAVFDLS